MLLVAVLLLIPWMGYNYVREMKSFLQQGQEEALQLTARAISTVLHDRVELFDPETGVPDVIGGPYDLYAYQLSSYPFIDGKALDWLDHRDRELVNFNLSGWQCSEDYVSEGFSFSHLLGYRGEYLYAFFRIQDSDLVFRDTTTRNIDNSDHIRFAIEDPSGLLRRFTITSQSDGRMSVYQMDKEWRYPTTGESVNEINAVFAATEDGYNVEFRVPRYLMAPNSGVAFTVVDVDDRDTRDIRATISTGAEAENEFGRLRVSSPELTRILGGIDRPVARVWILDKDQQVRAVVGSLAQTAPSDTPDSASSSAYSRMRNWVAERILGSPTLDFEDIPDDVSRRPEEIFKNVLAGKPEVQHRPSLDERVEIFMAAEPIFYGEEVLGAVVVEQSTTEILSLQYNALRNLTTVTLLVFVLVAAAMLWFASSLAYRIRRLRNDAEVAISPDGRLLNADVRVDPSGDEVGDLSRSMSGMLTRISEYTRYLERMPDTLAHEMSNPLNVVNSSLENLERESDPERRQEYIARASNGIRRLGTIVRTLTEAANLEDAIKADDPELFDLRELVESVIDGYRKSHEGQTFELIAPKGPLMINGMPDHIAQLLDKLADNAMNFRKPGTPIQIEISNGGDNARIVVSNQGPLLPEDLGDRLFDPMVSYGQKNATEMHLGLGLYIVRLIAESHRGSVAAKSKVDGSGAEFAVSLPLAA